MRFDSVFISLLFFEFIVKRDLIPFSFFRLYIKRDLVIFSFLSLDITGFNSLKFVNKKGSDLIYFFELIYIYKWNLIRFSLPEFIYKRD